MISDKAYVGPGTRIGSNTSVYQFASIIRGARLGDDCVVGSSTVIDGAVIGNNVRIGANCGIHPGAWIENDTFIGPGVQICNDLWPRAHKDRFDFDMIMAKICVRVEIGASLGANSTILPGIIIGEGAMVAAGSVVTRDVKPGYLWINSTQRLIRKTDETQRMRFVE